MRPLLASAWTVTSPLGRGRAATLAAFKNGRGSLTPCDFPHAQLDTWIGRVPGLEDYALPTKLAADWDCRNHRLAHLALAQDGFREACTGARERHGAANVGVFLGTSTSGIEHTEHAYRERDATGALARWFDYSHSQDMFALPAFVRESLGLTGPALAVSTACSSSAKVFATAARYIGAGLCRAAVVGGADSLCLMTLYGFHALQLVSANPCRPADAARDGINLGEAAGFALLERPEDVADARDVPRLLGYGESGDAHHMSAPHPDGAGAALAMREALKRSALTPADIDWVHLHGTATLANDLAEDHAVRDVFGPGQTASSTKGWCGHTLGAAGVLGFGFAALALEHGLIPASLNTQRVDPALSADIVLENRSASLHHVMVNAFGFGGSNASLIVGRGA
ncbi:MAG: beta-ketoacyl-[acyl-carrier-protein] synthase family protein [Gammaproteobacteria bacterium]